MNAARLSIVSNTLLALGKLAVGLATGSLSVLSEAAHSGSDLIASWIAYFSVRVSDRPADVRHPYGHGKAESLSGLAEAALIFGAAGYIIYEASSRLRTGEGPHRVDLGIAVMTVSIVLNTVVATRLFRVARQTDSLALEADAEHLRTDVFTSLGVLAGLILVHATGNPLLDPIAALVVAGMILRAAWRISRNALDLLMDARLPEEDVDVVRKILQDQPEVLGYHKLRTRKSGSSRYVDAHVFMDDHLTLLESHGLTEKLEDRIREELPNAEVTLHTEPFEYEQHHQMEEHGGPAADQVIFARDSRASLHPISSAGK